MFCSEACLPTERGCSSTASFGQLRAVRSTLLHITQISKAHVPRIPQNPCFRWHGFFQTAPFPGQSKPQWEKCCLRVGLHPGWGGGRQELDEGTDGRPVLHAGRLKSSARRAAPRTCVAGSRPQPLLLGPTRCCERSCSAAARPGRPAPSQRCADAGAPRAGLPLPLRIAPGLNRPLRRLSVALLYNR